MFAGLNYELECKDRNGDKPNNSSSSSATRRTNDS